MSKTLYDKIWESHLVHQQDDGTCLMYVDRHLIHEVTSPQAFEGLRTSGRKVRRPDATLAVPDHNVPTTPERKQGIIKDETSRIQVQTLAEKSLYGSAVYHHQQALALKQQGKLDQAKAAFEIAARAYAAYLQRYPRSKNAYEVQFFAAECQYNSLQFAAAAQNYDAIRDSTADTRYAKDAAFNAVLAWQKLLEQLQREKKLAAYPVLRSKDRPEGEREAPKAAAPRGKDPRTQLNEMRQLGIIEGYGFELVDQHGPPHLPIFVVRGRLQTAGGETLFTDPIEARSKKEGEAVAAEPLLALAIDHSL